MHLTDVSVGAFGSFAIVGAHLPIALGLALAAQLPRHRRRCRSASSATARRTSAPSTRRSTWPSIWKLPVIFVCENNLYGEYSPLATTTPIERLADRADGYAMAGQSIDGNDVRRRARRGRARRSRGRAPARARR